MTVSIKGVPDTDLDQLERWADKHGWEHIRHMVRNEKQVRV